jgi:hypothetical protein
MTVRLLTILEAKIYFCVRMELNGHSDSVFSDGVPGLTAAADRDAETFLVSWHQRWMPEKTILHAMAAIEEVQENIVEHGHHAERDAAAKYFEHIKKCIMAMFGFKGKKFRFIVDVAAYAHGFNDLLLYYRRGRIMTVRTQDDLALKWKCKKQNVSKALKLFQATCQIPERPDQRNALACNAMADARNEQLKI